MSERDEQRARIAEDGYLVLRRAVAPEELTSLRHQFLRVLQSWGWVAADGDGPPPGCPVRPRQEGGAGWWRPYADLQRLEAFHRLAHNPGLTTPLRALIGDDLFSHPRRPISLVFPGFTVPSHQDFSYVQGSVDTFAVWVPLAGAQRNAAVRFLAEAGSRRLRPLRQLPSRGVGTDVDDHDDRWREVSLDLGDAVVYHSLTVHAVDPNVTGRIALSCEYRYQSRAEPVCRGSLKPHHYPRVPDWRELTRGWSSRRWVRPPGRLRQVDFFMPHTFESWHQELAVPPSRFVAIDTSAPDSAAEVSGQQRHG